jgi:hypothetical protein
MPKWWPDCGLCARPVKRVAWTADPARPGTLGLRIECHGAAETTEVPTQAAFRAMGERPFAMKRSAA